MTTSSASTSRRRRRRPSSSTSRARSLAIGRPEYGFDVAAAAVERAGPARSGGTARSPRSGGAGVDAASPGVDVAAIGLTGQMHGLVLLDAADRVLRPAILWNDQRTAAHATRSAPRWARERLIEITGNDAVTGLTAPKLVWVRDHEPEVWDAPRTSCCPRTTSASSSPASTRWTRPMAPARCCSTSRPATGRRRCSTRSGSAGRGCRRRFEGPDGHGLGHGERRRGHGASSRHAGGRGRRRPGRERRRRRRRGPGHRGAVASARPA